MEVKDPTIWKWLGDPVDEQASTDTDTGEAMSLMESVLGIQSPEGGNRSSEGCCLPCSQCSDQQHTVLSDYSWWSYGYSSNSSQSSSRSTNSSECQCECRTGGAMNTKSSDQLEVPETTTPHQSPQQKQLKTADLNAHSTTPVPTTAASQPSYRMSSQVVWPQMS